MTVGGCVRDDLTGLEIKDIDMCVSLPELEETYDMTQNKYHFGIVWEHTMKVMEGLKSDSLELRMAALLHDIGKGIMDLKGLAPGPAVKECQEYLLKVAMSHKNITREEVIKQLMGYKPKKK